MKVVAIQPFGATGFLIFCKNGDIYKLVYNPDDGHFSSTKVHELFHP